MFAEQDSVLSRCGADLKGVIAFHSAFKDDEREFNLTAAAPGNGLFRVHSKHGRPFVRMLHPGKGCAQDAGEILTAVFKAESVEAARTVPSLLAHIAQANAHYAEKKAEKAAEKAAAKAAAAASQDF
jgi:hypothetical protein